MIVIADILKEQKATYSQIRRWCDMLGHYNSYFDEEVNTRRSVSSDDSAC